jgi:hypothetical protein
LGGRVVSSGVVLHHATRHNNEHLSDDTNNALCGWQCNAETCRNYHT